jgi:hypothetical protein
MSAQDELDMAKTKDLDIVTEARRLGQLAEKTGLKLPAGITGPGLIKEADAIAAELDAIEADKRALTTKIAAKDSAIAAMADKAKRIRSGVKAEYGDDSTEYENVGGKRASERKKPSPKAPPA